MNTQPENNATNNGASDAAKLMAYDANKKSTGVAYLLWFFLGGIGVHRFYLGKTGSGLLLMAITLVGLLLFPLLIVTAIWVIVDAFLIPGIIQVHNNGLVQKFG